MDTAVPRRCPRYFMFDDVLMPKSWLSPNRSFIMYVCRICGSMLSCWSDHELVLLFDDIYCTLNHSDFFMLTARPPTPPTYLPIDRSICLSFQLYSATSSRLPYGSSSLPYLQNSSRMALWAVMWSPRAKQKWSAECSLPCLLIFIFRISTSSNLVCFVYWMNTAFFRTGM